ncbi:MAG: OmpA family protein, partial [Marinobacter sp.]|nr:OmpA family protein [Marinobacter sp.]
MFKKIAIATTLSVISVSAQAGVYGAGIENSQWYLSESVFDCTLTHDVPGYGKAVFFHRAGESLQFFLEPSIPLMKPGRGQLVIEAPSWRPGLAPRHVGAVAVADGQRPVAVPPRQTSQLVHGLLQGMVPTVTRA